ELNGTGLSTHATTHDGNMKIESTGAAHRMKRRCRLGLSADMSREKNIHRFIVDQKLARNLNHAHARNAFFATAGCPKRKRNGEVGCHGKDPRILSGGRWFGEMNAVGMVAALINFEAAKTARPKLVLGEHARDRQLNGAIGVRL